MDSINAWLGRHPEIRDRITVVDQDGGGFGLQGMGRGVAARRAASEDDRNDVEVVVAGDGEVPHPSGGMAGCPAADDGDMVTGRGAEVVAGVQAGGTGPAAGGGVPERVVAGGADDGGPGSGPDLQVVQV